MKTSFTVGPWEYDEESGDVIAPKCGYQWAKGAPIIAIVQSLDYGEGSGNGTLIAAAPDLLAALQSMFNEFCEFEYNIETLNMARAAIAKATA